MKKLFSVLMCAAATAVVASTWSCDPNNKDSKEAVAEVQKLAAGDPSYLSTSIGFELRTTEIESYVYKIEEGENLPSPNPAMLYAEAKEKFTISDGTKNVFVYGVEGSKTYTIHFAFKIAGQNSYISKSVSSTTPAYDRLINVISADRRELVVQFNAPADQYYRYTIIDRLQYWEFGEQFGWTDYDWVKSGEIAQGPKIVKLTDGYQIKDPDSGEITEVAIKPGTAFVILYAKCDKDGVISIKDGEGEGGGGGVDPLYSPIKPNSKDYTEKCTDKHPLFTEQYAKLNIWTAAPIPAEGEFKVERTITELNAKFKITPPENVIRYGVAIFPKSMYTEQIPAAVGEDGAMSCVLTEFMTELTGVQNVGQMGMLKKDTTYMLILIGLCDDKADVQLIHTEEFKAITSDKPISVLEITQVDSPNNSPYFVSYNVKAKNGDCASAKYLMNGVREWTMALTNGVTEKSLTLEAGNKFTQAEINQINSPAGLVMNSVTWEDTENRLAIVSFNSDDRAECYTKDARSKEEPAKQKVNSPLFTSLLGTWDVTYKYILSGKPEEVVSKFKTVIATGPAEAASDFAPGQKQYDAMFKYYKNFAIKKGQTETEAAAYATKKIADEFASYKELVPRYTTKYRNQNRLVMCGFAYNMYTGIPYKSTWDLFCDTYYVSADIEQIFYEYGTKLFLEISEGDKVTLENNPTFIAPLSAYTAATFSAGGTDGKEIYQGSFPVEIVDDNTIKIKYTTTYNNTEYKFMTAYRQNNSPNFTLHTTATTDIVLTRAAATTNVPTVANVPHMFGDNKQLSGRTIDVFKRTYLPKISFKEPAAIEIPISTQLKSGTRR